LGLLQYYLGIEVMQRKRRIIISQTKYVSKLLKKFGMEDCKPAITPMEQNLKLSMFEGAGLVSSTRYRKFNLFDKYLSRLIFSIQHPF